MKLMNRKLIAAAVLASAATLSQAQTTIKLGWTTADSKVDPYAIAAHYFAEELEAAAPGEFNVQFYPNHQLGNDTETGGMFNDSGGIATVQQNNGNNNVVQSAVTVTANF